MTPEQARDALAAAVSTACTSTMPTLPVFYENADNVPIDTVADAFLRVGFDFTGAGQASMEASPVTRYTGELSLTHLQREGSGTKSLLARVEALNAELRHRTLSGLQLAVPRPGRKDSRDGWYSQEWVVPFWFHS